MGADGCRAASLYLGGFLVFAMIITSPIVGVFVVKPGLRGEHECYLSLFVFIFSFLLHSGEISIC